MESLHPLQSKVLQELSRHRTRRFSDMMAVTELTSDDFKFHLRKLVKLGIVRKNEDGVYELTADGKELANRFDYDSRSPIRQPKLTTATFVWRRDAETSAVQYLFQQRLRHPFFHYWGVVGEPVHWGESFETAATRGLEEQTGFTSALSFHGFYRQRDLVQGSKTILEDKLFAIFTSEWRGEKASKWPYAKNKWMTAEQFRQQTRRFDSCVDMLAMIEGESGWFADNTTTYLPEVY